MTNEGTMTNGFARIVLVQLNTDEQLNVREHEAIRVAIKALEQQTCDDAVSREAVLGLFAQNADAVRPYSKTWEEVKTLPSVNPQPICEEREKGECPYYAG